MIGHDIRAALPTLRQHAQSMMVDTVEIRRPSTAEPEFNETTGLVTFPEPAVLYRGKGRIRSTESNGAIVQVAEQLVNTVGLLVDVPQTVVDVRPDDVVAVILSRDPLLQGRELPITAVRGSSTSFKRVLVVIDNQG